MGFHDLPFEPWFQARMSGIGCVGHLEMFDTGADFKKNAPGCQTGFLPPIDTFPAGRHNIHKRGAPAGGRLKKYDILVIGSGAHIVEQALAHGLKVAYVDKGPVGGTCLNIGCIP
jgi:hypothetical protein